MVGGVDLHPVKARLLHPPGGFAEFFGDIVNFSHGGRPGLAVLLAPGGAGGDEVLGVELRVGVGPRVEELGEDPGPVGVDPVGQLSEGGDVLRPGGVELPGKQDPPVLIHADHLRDDKPHAPPGPGLVVGQHGLGHGAVGLGEAGGGGGHGHPVFDGQGPDGPGGGKQRIHGIAPFFFGCLPLYPLRRQIAREAAGPPAPARFLDRETPVCYTFWRLRGRGAPPILLEGR